jgi:hypothetical protein
MKKYIYLLATFLVLSVQVFAGPLHLHDHIEMKLQINNCNVHGFIQEEVEDEPVKTYKSSAFARDIINNIVNVVGLKPNFEIRAAEISNAAAVNYGGKRYILYDPNFMDKIQNAAQTDWAGISILAHEIGHHLNGHTMMRGGNPTLELEADEFSGFVLRKMGASLEDAQKAMALISNERGSSTHPARSARLAAIADGYTSANDLIVASVNQPVISSPEVQPQREEVALAQVAKNTISLPRENILREVHFNMLPDRTFYLTKKLNLVEVTDEGLEVLGDVSKTRNNNLVLNIYNENQQVQFNISSRGLLYNHNNKVVGYLKNPMA